jgi:hypothetical protein
MRAADSEYDPRRWFEGTMRRRPRRRETRWAMLVGLAFVVVALAAIVIRPGGIGPLAPVFVLLTIASTMSPFTREAFLTDKGFAAFDEFERQALLMAARRAYLIDMVVVATVFGWLAVGQRLGWPIPQLWDQWLALGAALLLIMAALPALIAEWTVPYPDVEDQSL